MKKESVITVGLNRHKDPNFKTTMDELESLAKACDLEVSASLVQNSHTIQNATYIGSGKVDELRMLAEAHEVDRIVFNHELTPSQLRNLERMLDLPIMDRTALILEIFSQRARTREAKLQVELASLQYLLPRLAGSYTALGRQGGGVGTKNKGAGEKKIELDKRRAEQKITELQKALEGIERERTTQRKRRQVSQYPKVALVGYTNSGKSTLMNAFLQRSHSPQTKSVFEKNMLFATLDTSVRLVSINHQRKILLSDTVGFVSNLPHNLVKAFGSTLEEVVDADLLIHVIDRSNPDYKMQITVTEKTLDEIGASEIPMLYVFNKCDLAFDAVVSEPLETLQISAKNQTGFEALEDAISEIVFKSYVSLALKVPFEEGRLIHEINENAFVKSTELLEDGTLFWVECAPHVIERFKPYQV